MNQIQTLTFYRENRMWVYDDPTFGKKAEPLILGASELLDRIIAADTGKYIRDPVEIAFSAQPFPGAHCAWRIRLEDGGAWYHMAGDEAWLCPALLDYFPVAPEHLYVSCLGQARYSSS
jgi:hypothetical protein